MEGKYNMFSGKARPSILRIEDRGTPAIHTPWLRLIFDT